MTDFYFVGSQRGNVQTYNMKVNQEEGSGFSSHPGFLRCESRDGRLTRPGSAPASHLEQTEAAWIIRAAFYPQNPTAGCEIPRLELLYLLPKCDNDHEHEAVAGNKRHILEIKSNPCSAQGNDAEPEQPPENHRLSLYFLSAPLQLWDSALLNYFRMMLNCVSASCSQIWTFFCVCVSEGGWRIPLFLPPRHPPRSPGSLRWQSHKPH